MGALLADASPSESDLVYSFGRNLGIAFQIQDDLLDTFGDPLKFGKKVGGDIAQNKKTFLFLKALEVAPEEIKNRLLHLYQEGDLAENEKIEQVKAIFNELEIARLAEAAKSDYQNLAMEQLEELANLGRDVTTMKQFAELLMAREE